MVLHRPLLPDEELRTWVTHYSTRPRGRHAMVTLHYQTRDVRDEVVAEQWWTTVYVGATCQEGGSSPPDHRFPEGAADRPSGSYKVLVDPDMARRYAEVSGDWSPHHFDSDAARASGSERPFLHGLCTLALCAQGAVDVLASGDPDRVRRVAVRFAAPVVLGSELNVRFYEAVTPTFAFEARVGDRPAITHGLVELRR